MRRVRRVGWLAGGAVVSTVAGFAAGIPWLLPVLGAAAPYPLYLKSVRHRDYRGAVGWVLLWALLQSGVMMLAVTIAPERAGEVVLTGSDYAAEMLHWIRTGDGAEGSPALFLPIHLRHLAGFLVLCFFSAGALGIVLGTFLLNYMNFYVATLIEASATPGLAMAFGWPVWAVLRVAGFVVAGAAVTRLALTLLDRFRGGKKPVEFPRRVFLIGLALVLADIVLKATLAPAWRTVLLRGLEGS